MKPSLAGHIAIARPDHWIKNVFVLPGIVLAVLYDPTVATVELTLPLAVGLFSVCLVASSNYTINELLDAKHDLSHPEKRDRPVPSGQVSVPLAWLQWALLYAVGGALAYWINIQLFWTVTSLWVMGLVYNVRPIRTKELPWIDVMSEAINNPIRLLAGWFMVGVSTALPFGSLLLSYWFVGCYFMALKRYSELRYLNATGADASAYRASFGWYTPERLLTSIMFHAAASMLFFGAFLMRYRIELVLAFPFIAAVMAAYLNLAFDDDSPVREPERLHKSKPLMATTILCAVVMLVLLIVDIPLAEVFVPTVQLTR